MNSFSLVIEYLTGYCVATDPASRERPEWPPHPARVFMALAAAHFETDAPDDQKQRERDALEWLAALESPSLTVPPHTEREVLTVYVPVNDQKGGDALLQRSRQPRTFPRVHIGSEPLRLIWQCKPEGIAEHGEALESICRKVSRIGHSSSLAWVRLERKVVANPTHVPDEHASEHRFRIVQEGATNRLVESFNEKSLRLYADAWKREEQKGKSIKQVENALKKQFPFGQPVSQRPVFSISQGYRRATRPATDTPSSSFDPNFIVLRASNSASQQFGLESTLQVANALRGLLLSSFGSSDIPPWISGHEPNGDKLQSGPHIAIVPLAFVGRHGITQERFADGHLMGLGILVPNSVEFRERAKVLAPIIFDKENQPRPLPLTLGKAGVWVVERETSFAPKRNLRTETYTKASRTWASVTPVVLDHMPKSDRVKQPIEWREEVATIIAQSCEFVGLPSPIAVRAEKTPFFVGSLCAMPGQGGFPLLRKGTFQVHAAVEFAEPVAGPVLIGAGRFRGYGLMRPWQTGEA